MYRVLVFSKKETKCNNLNFLILKILKRHKQIKMISRIRIHKKDMDLPLCLQACSSSDIFLLVKGRILLNDGD